MIARYFGKFNRSRQDRWVFGDRASGAYLHRFAWTGIVRHQIVRYRASPDDPALTEYWASRRRKAPLPVNRTNRWLLTAQDGRCHACNGTLHAATDRPQNPARLGTMAGRQPRRDHDDHDPGGRHDGRRLNPVSYTPTALTAAARHLCPPRRQQGLLEPDALKGARPVLRRAGRRKALGLSDQTGREIVGAALVLHKPGAEVAAGHGGDGRGSAISRESRETASRRAGAGVGFGIGTALRFMVAESDVECGPLRPWWFLARCAGGIFSVCRRGSPSGPLALLVTRPALVAPRPVSHTAGLALDRGDVMLRRRLISAVCAVAVLGVLGATIASGVAFAKPTPNPQGVRVDRTGIIHRVFTDANCSVSKRDGFTARSRALGTRLNVHIQPFRGFDEYPLEPGKAGAPYRRTFVDFISPSGLAFASDYVPPYPIGSLGAIKFSDDGKLIGVAFQPMFDASGSQAVIVTGVMVCHYPKKLKR